MPFVFLLTSVISVFGISIVAVAGAGNRHGPIPATTTPNPNTPATTPIKLESYRVNKDQITLSGFSSGGSFAQQLQISYSSLFTGIAVFSHTYYGCGEGDGSQLSFDNVCTLLGRFPNDRLYDPARVAAEIQAYFRQGLIEDPANLRNKKLYVYAGTNNWLFSTDQSLRILNIYEPLIGNPLAIFTRVQPANLSLPSDTFGDSCSADSSRNFYIANCGINGPYEALRFLLTDYSIQKPSMGRQQQLQLQPLLHFDQTEFYPVPLVRHDMDTVGFLYIPQRCQGRKFPCLLHFYFHGCLAGREFMGENHIRNSGYLELAETNGIIMVFPQAVGSEPENAIGCWDTFNITGSQFATQRGAQVTVVRNMLTRILGRSGGGQLETIVTSSARPSAGRPSFEFSNRNHHNGYGHGNKGAGGEIGWRRRYSREASPEILPLLAVVTPLVQQ